MDTPPRKSLFLLPLLGFVGILVVLTIILTSTPNYQNPFDVIESQTESPSTNPFTSLR